MSLEIVPTRTTKISRKERMERARQELEKMNDKLRAEFDEIKKIINNRVIANLRELWKLGSRIKAIHDREHEYGANAIGRMSICLGQDQSVLYLAMRFYTFYDEEDLEELLKHKTRFGGTSITWSHLAQLLRVANVKERARLQKRVFDEDLTPEELHEEVNKLQGPSGRKGIGGRPLKVPASSTAMMSNIISQSYFWERNYNNIWGQGKNIVQMVMETPADKVTPEFLEKIDQSIAYMERIQQEAESMKKYLDEARQIAVKKAEAQARSQASVVVHAVSNGKGRKKPTAAN